MAVALGGRVAEELIFGEDDITTGASGDFQQVTRTARLMVTQLGFSKKLGQVRHAVCRALEIEAWCDASAVWCLCSWASTGC
jgi:ATP-dependent Zn protease